MRQHLDKLRTAGVVEHASPDGPRISAFLHRLLFFLIELRSGSGWGGHLGGASAADPWPSGSHSALITSGSGRPNRVDATQTIPSLSYSFGVSTSAPPPFPPNGDVPTNTRLTALFVSFPRNFNCETSCFSVSKMTAPEALLVAVPLT